MRKVTASAVILTALTGCSQSNIPSTQWSFEVPSEDQASNSTEATLVSERPLATGLSEDAQSFVSQATGGRMMGPAFEQPTAEIPLGARVSTVGRPGSKEVSTLAAEAYGIANGLSTQPSTRPDPVAQVRAYLRASGSPSALTSRTPYASEVYLSALPTPNRYYEPSIPQVDTALPVGTSELGITGTLPVPFSNAEPTVDGAVSNNAGVATQAINSLQADIFQASSLPSSAASVVTLSPEIFDTDTFNAVASATGFTEANSFDNGLAQDGLPQLEASLSIDSSSAPADADGYAALPVNTPAVVTEASTSIGTAILQNLQNQALQNQNVASADVSEQEGLPSLNASATGIETTQFEAAQLETAQFETVQNIQSDFTASAATASFYEPLESDAAFDSTYAYAPTASTQTVPSLASLTETMPAREISPLVDSFRSLSDVLPASAPSVHSDLPAADSSLEAFSDTPEQQPSYAPDSVFESSSNFNSSEVAVYSDNEIGTEVDEAYSPLLQGFVEPSMASEVEPTIYVPIAEDSAPASSIMLQDASDTFNEEVSTTDFLNKLSAQDTFSSLLVSSAFIGDRPLITLTSLQSQTDEKVQSNLKSAAHRNTAVTLAAKQTSKRRQRLTWM
ncbi:MAG: hypothetical protein AB8B99_04765 [Phormidesmis sp.]